MNDLLFLFGGKHSVEILIILFGNRNNALHFLDSKLVFKHFLKGLFCKMVNSNYANCTETKWSYSLRKVC